MNLLLTNDDGHKAAGIRALLIELSRGYEVVAVAPAHEQSWISKSITRHAPLTIEEAEYFEYKGYIVDGTPADCSQLGMYQVLDALPDFVVSGINIGSNVGYEEILSSGTVGAALEAALQGVPAFATSIDYSPKIHGKIEFNEQEAIKHFIYAAEITRKVIDRVMAAGFPENTHLISINIPWGVASDAPWVITKPHTSRHKQLFGEVEGKYKHQGNVGLREAAASDSDLAALNMGYVSILPMSVQLTTPEEQRSLSKALDVQIFNSSLQANEEEQKIQ